MRDLEKTTPKQAHRLEDLASLIQKLARQLHLMNYARDLKPAQWQALRFFGRQPIAQRTVSAFSTADGISQPAASQTVVPLIQRGLMFAIADHNDRRIRRISLTPAGEAILAMDPLSAIYEVLTGFDQAELDQLHGFMSRLVAHTAPANDIELID
jgi:DNA-binding MarR family transcriptional regulator